MSRPSRRSPLGRSQATPRRDHCLTGGAGLLVLLLVASCGSRSGATTDATTDRAMDGPPVDGGDGAADLATGDAGGESDATVEAGAMDVGAVDSSALDASTADAGADGALDAGTADAGADGALDAGTADAGADGALDAGTTDASDDGASACPEAGVSCAGPVPACASECADSDGDGLNDAWETAEGIDMNCDGVIDAQHDVPLPGADPHRPDVYVRYDWLDYGAPGNACSADSDCTFLGSGHTGETCSGPPVLGTAPGSCRYACVTDADCTSRTPGDHATEKCMGESCVHTHDPEVTAPGAMRAVSDAFGTYGIGLHVLRGQAQPHSVVTSFRQDKVMAFGCEGGSHATGTAGVGKYAVSLYDLKALSKVDPRHIAYHYAFFAHYSSCDSQTHCAACATATNPDGSPKNGPVSGQSGIAEISGNDFIVSLASRAVDIGLGNNLFSVGTTFMHELGHNLGLHHGGGIDKACTTNADCSPSACETTPVGRFCLNANDDNWKPNYLSVMNYRYQFSGIIPSKVVGGSEPIACASDGDCPSLHHCHSGVCARLDFSPQVLPTGGNTPGALEERNTGGLPGLSEPAGLGAATSDLFTYTDAMCDIPPTSASTIGPVDWDGDGDPTATAASADLSAGVDHLCGGDFMLRPLGGAADWTQPFNYAFQCNSYGGPNGDGAGAARRLVGEMSTRQALDAHVMYPIRSVHALLRARGSRNAGETLVIFGAPGLTVADIDAASIVLRRSRPARVTVRDVNHDGRPDLVATFEGPSPPAPRAAKQPRLRGWLKSSQLFTAIVALP